MMERISRRQVFDTRGTGGLPQIMVRVCACIFLAGPLFSQALLQSPGLGRVLPFGADAAVLDTREPRADLPCTVEPQKPEIGFDLKFHAGFQVTLPLRDLLGGEDLLTIIFRVTPQAHPDEPVYFSEKISVPKLDAEAKGQAVLDGSFVVGEGEYQVDWLMRDRSERMCSFYWTTSASLKEREKPMHLAVVAEHVEPIDPEPFRQEPPTAREGANGLNVKVLVNFAPQRALAASLQPLDTAALVSILRNISREPRIGKFSLVAFNMQEQRVVYRQDAADQINFPALGDSLNSLKLGTVRVDQLEQKHSDTEFLTQLITKEMANDHPDAVIFAGPKVMVNEGIPTDSIKALSGDISYPVFYMNYNLTPQTNPWRDAIGNVVKKLRGYEYTISRPHDLWNAWTDIMGHIVKLKMARLASVPTSTH
jgi:hypothetical protein